MDEGTINKLKKQFDKIEDYKSKVEFLLTHFTDFKLPYIINHIGYGFSSYREEKKFPLGCPPDYSLYDVYYEYNYFSDDFSFTINGKLFPFNIFPTNNEQLEVYGELVNRQNMVELETFKNEYSISKLYELKKVLKKNQKRIKSDYYLSKLFEEDLTEIEFNFCDSDRLNEDKSFTLGRYSKDKNFKLYQFPPHPIKNFCSYYAGYLWKELSNMFNAEIIKEERIPKDLDFSNIKVKEFIDFLLSHNINVRDPRKPKNFIDNTAQNKDLLEQIFRNKSISPKKVSFNKDQKTLGNIFRILFLEYKQKKNKVVDLAKWISTNFSTADQKELDGKLNGYVYGLLTNKKYLFKTEDFPENDIKYYQLIQSVKLYIKPESKNNSPMS